MVYDIALYSFLIMIVCVMLSSGSSSSDGLESIGVVAGLCLVITVVLGILNFIGSAREPLNEYAQELHQQMPTLKGKLICDDDTLTFKGTQDVQFVWKDHSYQIAYPTSVTLSEIATACRLGVKPFIESSVAKLEENVRASVEKVNQTLTNQALPKEISPEERKLLNRLLMTLNPVDIKKVTVLSAEGSDDSKLKVQHSSDARVVEASSSTDVRKAAPAHAKVVKKASTDEKKPTGLSNQEFLKNISAQ